MRHINLRLMLLAVVCSNMAYVAADESEKKEHAYEVPTSAEASTIWESKASSSWTTESALLIKLNSTEKSGEIKGARLANVVRKIHWLGYPDQELSLHPEPDSWSINFDSIPEKATTIVIELDGPPAVFDPKVVVTPSAENQIVLPAKLAETHGSTLRYEPQPHKNTVGYWSDEKDTASWQFGCAKTGVYEIDVLQGCGKGHGGSKVEVRVAGQALKFEVQETGHFQNFIWRTVGEVTLTESDSQTLQIVPVNKANGAVMDVRMVRLVPKGAERSRDPELVDPKVLPKFQ